MITPRTLLTAIWLVSATAGTATAGLIGLWEFEDSLSNSVPGGNPAVLHGSFTSSTFVGGTALQFPRPSSWSDRLGIPNDTGANLDDYTVVLDFSYPSFQATFSIFMEVTFQNTQNDYFVGNDGSIGLFNGPTSGQETFSEDTLHRVGITRNASSDINVYVDGVNVASGNGAGPRDGPILPGGPWLFTDNGTEASAGLVSTVALYDRVLSPLEMANLGGPGTAIPEPSSVILFTFVACAGLALRGYKLARQYFFPG